MQLDNIRVSRKLWFAFLGLMVAMALVSGIAQNRGNTTMARAMDAVVDIDTRAVAAVRWRGGTETAVKNQQNFNDLSVMQTLAERVLGVNDQMMGALGGSSRKTATEVRTSTGFGVNRLKTIAEYLSATGFSSHAQKIVANTQQFYTGEKKFRIAGSLALDAGAGFINVNPELIAGSFQFVPVDGTLPIDRMAQVNQWKEILQGLGRMPQIAMAYDLGKIFAWMANLAGLKNINQFKIQVLPPGVGPSPGMVAAQPPGTPPSGDTRQGGIASPPAEMPQMPMLN